MWSAQTLLAGLLLVAAAGSAQAQPRVGAPPEPQVEVPAAMADLPAFELNLAVDIPVALGAFAISLAWPLVEGPPAYCAPLCDPAGVNGIDRGSAGNYNPDYSTMSNVALLTALAGSVATVLVDGSFVNALNDGLVILESSMVSLAIMATVNLATRRPRPYLYSDSAPLEDRLEPWAALSFPSGHSATVAAVAASTFYTMLRRRPGTAVPWIVLGVGTVLTGAVIAGRIAGGNHFPTDTAVGALIGAAVGIAVPAAHADPRAALAGGALLPAVGPEQAGLTYLGRW